jgi:hypothetical protein
MCKISVGAVALDSYQRACSRLKSEGHKDPLAHMIECFQQDIHHIMTKAAVGVMTSILSGKIACNNVYSLFFEILKNFDTDQNSQSPSSPNSSQHSTPSTAATLTPHSMSPRESYFFLH